MILISHRGNLTGPNKDRENSPLYIQEALDNGYDVEIDVWFINGQFFLGHDEPTYKIDISYLINDRFWCHTKNIDALLEIQKYLSVNDGVSIHYFWHENDTVTLTSNNWVWAYPGKQPIKNSISVLPELYNDDVSHCGGVCSDFIEKYKND